MKWFFIIILLLQIEVFAWDPAEDHAEITLANLKNDSRIKTLMRKVFATESDPNAQYVGEYWDDEEDWEGEAPWHDEQWIHLQDFTSFNAHYNPSNVEDIPEAGWLDFWQFTAGLVIGENLGEWYPRDNRRYNFLRMLAHHSADVAMIEGHSPVGTYGEDEFFLHQTIELYPWVPQYRNSLYYINLDELVDNEKKFQSFQDWYDANLRIHETKVVNNGHAAIDAWRSDGILDNYDEEKYGTKAIDFALTLNRFLIHIFLHNEYYGTWDAPFSKIDVNAMDVFEWRGSGVYTYADDYMLVGDTEDCPDGYERGSYVADDDYFNYTNTNNCKKEIVSYDPKVLKVRSFGLAEINGKQGQSMVINSGDQLTVIADDKIVIKNGFHAKRGSKIILKN